MFDQSLRHAYHDTVQITLIKVIFLRNHFRDFEKAVPDEMLPRVPENHKCDRNTQQLRPNWLQKYLTSNKVPTKTIGRYLKSQLVIKCQNR